jgi:hypothetical protein
MKLINLSRPDSIECSDAKMNTRLFNLLRRQREIEAEQEELSRELREISREIFERRNDALFADMEKANLLKR